jgi:hypothetical protein
MASGKGFNLFLASRRRQITAQPLQGGELQSTVYTAGQQRPARPQFTLAKLMWQMLCGRPAESKSEGTEKTRPGGFGGAVLLVLYYVEIGLQFAGQSGSSLVQAQQKSFPAAGSCKPVRLPLNFKALQCCLQTAWQMEAARGPPDRQ